MLPLPVEPLSMVDLTLLNRLVTVACERHHGHLTVMRSTTNWRIGFGTPRERRDISRMPKGATFNDAARSALADPQPLYDSPNGTEARFAQVQRERIARICPPARGAMVAGRRWNRDSEGGG